VGSAGVGWSTGLNLWLPLHRKLQLGLQQRAPSGAAFPVAAASAPVSSAFSFISSNSSDSVSGSSVGFPATAPQPAAVGATTDTTQKSKKPPTRKNKSDLAAPFMANEYNRSA
ncbi:MAG: hypothetical protein SGPRY_008151, partial [Prymnesium sp.]